MQFQISALFFLQQITRKDRYTQLENVLESIQNQADCCKEKCVSHFDLPWLIQTRNDFHRQTEQEQRQFILDHLNNYKGTSKLLFNLSGKDVCRTAWCFAYGISLSR